MSIKKILLLLFFAFCFSDDVFSQGSNVFFVSGDANKFYPVSFEDGGYNSSTATILDIGRSGVHETFGDWWGSMIVQLRFHTTNWGNGSSFIDANVRQKFGNPNIALIAGWKDVTALNGTNKILVWLRGQTHFYYQSNYPVNPVVYDNIVHPLPYQEPTDNNTFVAHTFKTAPDSYVNVNGSTYESSAYFLDPGVNYFAGNIGIGTKSTGTSKLAVEGTIAARKIKVTLANPWPDFVFDSAYRLPSLKEVENYLTVHKHLSDVPSAADIEKDGHDLGDMNRVLLQKVEEQTLYLIELKKESEKQQVMIDQLMQVVKQLQNIPKSN